MTFADLTLFSASVEARYPDASMLWDRSGLFWSRLSAKLGELKRIQAQPNETVFRLGRQFELAARIQNAQVYAFRPDKTLGEYGQVTDKFFRTLVDVLEISEYSRVGCRLLFAREFPSIRAASDAVLETGRLKWPQGQYFNKTGTPVHPEWAFRWEDNNTGVHLRLRVEERKYEMDPPLVWEGDFKNKDTIAVTYDIDWYTRARVLVTQMSYADWINQCLHAVHRDSDQFLAGL